jgi:ABC-type sugar transport system ATPase subunit
MRNGVIEQCGDPDEVYERPANTFVAGFIGSPAMSLARVRAERRNGSLELVLGDTRLALSTDADVPADVIAGVRPEHARLWDSESGLLGPLHGSVDYVEALGRETLFGVTGPGGAKFVLEAEGHVRAEPGETLTFGLRPGWVYLFDPADERALGRI